LLLDVDGPLNPYDAKPWRRPVGYHTWRYIGPGALYTDREYRQARAKHAMRVWLNPDHGPMLLDLAATTGLELVWATTWGSEANRCIGPAIGLPELPVIRFGEPDWGHAGWSMSGAWKWRAVADYADGRPLAWLDDEHNDVTYVHARAVFDRRRAGTPTLLCHVDPRTGLLPDHLATVRSWADRRNDHG